MDSILITLNEIKAKINVIDDIDQRLKTLESARNTYTEKENYSERYNVSVREDHTRTNRTFTNSTFHNYRDHRALRPNYRHKTSSSFRPVNNNRSMNYQANEQLVKSSNSDFTSIVWNTYHTIQLDHHLNNWVGGVPEKLQDNLEDFMNLITPPCPDTKLKEHLNELKKNTLHNIQMIVLEHINNQREQLKQECSRLNPLDKEQAAEVGTKIFIKRFGRKADNTVIKSSVEDVLECVRYNFEYRVDDFPRLNREELIITETVPQEASVNVTNTSRQKKRGREEVTPVSTKNRFDALSELDEDSEEDTHTNKRVSKQKTPDANNYQNNAVADQPVTSKRTADREINNTKKNEQVIYIDNTENSPMSRNTTKPTPAENAERCILCNDTPTITTTPNNSIPSNPGFIQTITKNSTTENNNSNDLIQSSQPERNQTNNATSASPLSFSQEQSNTSPGKKYVHEGKAKKTWKIQLKPTTKSILIGDSNCKLIEDIPHGCEVHSFCGAKFNHVAELIRDMNITRPVKIAVSVGLNNRGCELKTSKIDLSRMMKALEDTQQKVAVVGISIPNSLNGKDLDELRELNNLKELNNNLANRARSFITPINSSEVCVSTDGIHYTKEVVDRIFNKIKPFLRNH